MRFSPCLLLSLFPFFLLSCGHTPQGPAAAPVTCELGIVGGGPAGVYLAYRLAPRLGDRICLLEKEEKLGGRIRDENADLTGKKEIWVGTGARRVNATQGYVLALGRELGIDFEKPQPRAQLIHTRGRHGYSANEFVPLFPRLKTPAGGGLQASREDGIYDQLLRERDTAPRFSSQKDYFRHVAGDDAVAYLRGMSRFHGDFDYDLSAPNYMDYLVHENALSSENLYPVGGMSAFIRRMEAALERGHVRIFRSEPLTDFEPAAGGPGYILHTPAHTFSVRKLVLAVPPSGLDRVGGGLAERVRERPEYRALVPIRVVVINQWWPEAWWKQVRNPRVQGDSGLTWRGWSTESCVTHTEIPQEEYLHEAKVTRSVYTDDPRCARYWENLRDQGGLPAVEREVVRGLKDLFDHHLTRARVRIPRPLRTSMQVWPGAWYYVRAGAAVSNAAIASWSVEPLAGRADLMLLGEAYWPDRPGWTEGAYFSADQLLARRFGGEKRE